MSFGSEGGSRDRLAIAARTATELARLDPAQEALAERLNGLAAEADDLALDLRRLTAALADELTDVSAIEERLGLLYGLLRKYGGDEQEVLAHAADARAEAERLAGFESERKRRSADAELLEQTAREAASLLTQARRETAGTPFSRSHRCTGRPGLSAGSLCRRPRPGRAGCLGRRRHRVPAGAESR